MAEVSHDGARAKHSQMTGLDVAKEEIIQIACYVTDYDLNLLDEAGFEIVVHQDEELMNKMDAWCTKTHARTGLTERVLKSDVSPDAAAKALLEYVTKLVPERGAAILAGNSVSYDQSFLRKGPYAKLLDHLHHRIFDVSSIKEAVRRWSTKQVLEAAPRKTGSHEARQDILESIEEARYYRDTFFRPSPNPPSQEKETTT
jgi:oligoribonuclease